MACNNVSQQTRKANVLAQANTVTETKLATKLLPKVQTQFAGGSQQLLRAKQIANHRQRRQAHHQQIEAEDGDTGTKREARVQPHLSATKCDARIHELRIQCQYAKFTSSLKLCQNARSASHFKNARPCSA